MKNKMLNNDRSSEAKACLAFCRYAKQTCKCSGDCSNNSCDELEAYKRELEETK